MTKQKFGEQFCGCGVVLTVLLVKISLDLLNNLRSRLLVQNMYGIFEPQTEARF